MSARERKILELLTPSVEDMGFELIDVEYHTAPKSGTLRLYIGRPQSIGQPIADQQGIDVEDCEAVSRQVSGILDVEDPISGMYHLEVSSPGLDRVLRTPAHFAAFVGSEVTLRLRQPVEGRRKMRGVLAAAADEKIEVTVDNTTIAVDLAQIEKARLVPDYTDLL